MPMTLFRIRWTCPLLAAVLALGCGNKPATKTEESKAPAEQSAEAAPPKEEQAVNEEAAPAAPASESPAPAQKEEPKAESTNADAKEEEIDVAAVYSLPADDGKGEKLTVEEIKAFLADPKNLEPIKLKTPLGHANVQEVFAGDNSISRAKAELGRMLYFDPRLSEDSTVSCASCHDPATGWAQHTPVAAGIRGQKGGRNSPTVLNRAFGKVQFWDGRAATLEDQALGPIQNPIEMGFNIPDLVKRLKESEGYRLMFEKTYGDITPENIAKAIATFERTVISGPNPNDYYTQAEAAMKLTPEEIEDLEPEDKARVERVLAEMKAHPMSEAAIRGRELYFKKAECSLCHVGTNLTDELFHNIGVGMDKEKPDIGRHEVTKKDEDKGAFKTPSLRNIVAHPPYMHDGSEATLIGVVEFYDKGGVPNPQLSKRIRKLNLTKQEKEDLVAFLTEGLTGPMPDIKRPKLPQ
ncbi:MAG: cytochrome c peroxidase [Planctomycetota bacterium]